ncbi:MAG: thiamine-phosphate kinase, partial [Acidobacteria bacterium]|nr:thiamine-phosphate kinase [Acidobacteriota bacterium]
AKDLLLGIGDDAAILREQSGRETLLTVDLLVEEIDFKLEYTLPRWLGHKALAVSLSDIAAMGGTPRFSLLTLGISKTNPQSDEFWEEFFAGYHALADEHGVTLIGGDLSSTFDRLTIDSLVVGHCTSGRAIRRSGARVGDAIYMTGCVGASAAGLKLLLQGARVNEKERSLLQKALRTHLKPEPPVAFGRQIGEFGLAHAMIDVSDGLAQDLAHICEESRVGAIIETAAVPVAEEVSLIAEGPESASAFAISSGEDFELLLTANNDLEERLFEIAESCEIKITRIGEIIENRHNSHPVLIRCDGDVKPLLVRGYDHFLV